MKAILAMLLTIAGSPSLRAIGLKVVTEFPETPMSVAKAWDIDIYGDNWAFFATQDGMIQYDGSSALFFTLNNKYSLRSVAVDRERNRVYAGGISEFGYFEPSTDRSLSYVCLSDSVGDDRHIGNIWGIYPSHDTVIAQGDVEILIYDEKSNTHEIIDAGCKLDCSEMIDGVLWLGTDDGLKFLMGRRAADCPGAEVLKGARIRAILPFEGSVIVVTADKGVYRYDKGTLTRLEGASKAAGALGEVFSADVKGSLLALGSIDNGIGVVNLTSGTMVEYNEGNGLQNNTVLKLKFDTQGDLWGALDLGITKIRMTYPVETLNNNAIPIGSGSALATMGGKMYMGTNRGLFYTDYLPGLDLSREKFRRVEGVTGQVWSLSKIDGELFCCNDRGLYVVTGDKAKPVADIVGVWSVERSLRDSSALYAGTYFGIFELRREGGAWRVASKLEGYDGSCYNFVQESPTAIWSRDGEEGIYRLSLDAGGRRVTQSELFKTTSDGVPLTSEVSLSRIDNDIYFSTPSGIYRYKSKDHSIVPDEPMRLLLGSPRNVRRIKKTGGWLYALTDKELLRSDPAGILGMRRVALANPGLLPMHEGDVLFGVAPEYLAYPTAQGYAFYDFSDESRKGEHAMPIPRINRVAVTARKDSIIYASNFAGIKPHLTIDYADNSIKIEYGIGSEIPGTRYSCRLNDDKWSEPTPWKAKEFTNLREGNYRFEVKAFFADGSETSDSIEFTVLPPWWRSVWAILLYALLAGAAVWGCVLLERRRVRLRQLEVAKEKDEEMARRQADFEWETRLKDHKIVELEKEQLDKELRHKAQEMATAMMSLAHKNETLQTVKKELQNILAMLPRTSADVRKAISDLQGKVTVDIKSDDVLNRVVEEFDLVHNDFIKRLRARYPDVNNNEVLMCAYLKMGLSTKEIAPLLNISVRGVETMRYRIRKKFNLEREDSLTDFLQKSDGE